MQSAHSLIAALAVLALSSPARADLLVGAEGEPNRPLIVVLHGDEGTPHKVMGLWRSVAKSHRAVVFAPRCPKAEGCAGSWWRHNGAPSWLLERVETLTTEHAIDADRRYLVGWSGGATYMGLNAGSWFETFAAIALAGGGAAGGGCHERAGGDCGPVYYLMGDRNPHFDLAEATRDHFEACGHAVHWDKRAGATHTAEWHAFAASRDAIATWLLARKRACLPPPVPEPTASPSAGPSTVAPAPAPSPSAPPVASPAPTPHCGCTLPGGHAPRPWFAFVALLALLARRRHACHSRA